MQRVSPWWVIAPSVAHAQFCIMELRFMPLFTVDSGDHTTTENQLKWVETVYMKLGTQLGLKTRMSTIRI